MLALVAAGTLCQASFFCVRSHLSHLAKHIQRSLGSNVLLHTSGKLTLKNSLSILIATRTTTVSYFRFIKSGKESMAPPRGPRGGEKPKGQRQNRDANRGGDDRRDEQSRAASRQDGRSGDRGRGVQGAGDGRGKPDFPSGNPLA